jgi:long-chain acyl-CoA synthetase
MTETTAAGIRSQSGDLLSNIGLLTPFFNTDMKVLSVPEMGYMSTDTPPRGELLIRGPQITLCGYYKDPESTALAFDKDGYVHTGDIVALVQPHQVRLIDRRKNMFKLAQGEYVSGESIEGLLLQSPYIASVFIHGDSTQPYPVAIVVPNEETIFEWAATQPGLEAVAEAKDMGALCGSDTANKFLLSEITRLSKQGGLKGYEFVHHIKLHETPFDEERGMVSPSLKLKRHVLKKYFEEDLKELCALNH